MSRHLPGCVLELVETSSESRGCASGASKPGAVSRGVGADATLETDTDYGSRPLPPGLWYLKDWHFVAACPGYKAYQVPSFLSSDWLNSHYDMLAAQSHTPQSTQQVNSDTHDHATEPSTTSATRTSDYRFVYLGPQGSWTPLHSDVLRSYSWSGNVAGRKRWLLLPPEHTYLVYDRLLSTAAPDWCLPGACRCAPGTCPGSGSWQQQAVQADLADRFPLLPLTHSLLYEVIQEAGELLFVPSGWHHTVVNLTDTLSINHNWFNAHNAHWCWSLVSATHLRAAESIQDCRALCGAEEWWGLVQNMVAADCGLNLRQLAHLCAGVIARALAVIRSHGPAGVQVSGTGAMAEDNEAIGNVGRLSSWTREVVEHDIKSASGVLRQVVDMVVAGELGSGEGADAAAASVAEMCEKVGFGTHAEFVANSEALLMACEDASGRGDLCKG